MIFLIISSAACIAQENTSQKQEDPISEQKKAIGYFEKVNMNGGGNLIITQSSGTSLKIVDKRSCLKSVRADVKSQTLEIHRINDSSKNCRPKIYIGTPKLKKIQLGGGGDVIVNRGFGTIDSFQCVLDGGGKVDMETLKVHSFYATINGGGTLSIHVDKLLEADVNGGGAISYQGNPKVISNISGGGSVKQH